MRFRFRVVLAPAVALGYLFLPVVAARAQGAPEAEAVPPPKKVVIPKVSGSVKIDGELDEPAWTQAAVLTPFYRNDGSGREREATQVRVWYDDEALYLGWTCRDQDIQATFKARDSKFWEEEVVEFFVTPKDLTRYFELQWNPLGGVFDAVISNRLDERGLSRKYEGDWGFTARGMTNAVRVNGTVGKPDDQDELWQVEVRIPFADLGQATPKPGDVWRGNFYRFNRTRGLAVEELSWSPTLHASFHQPARFGFLEFGGPKNLLLPR